MKFRISKPTFSLRLLLLMMALFTIVLCFGTRRATRQKHSVERLREIRAQYSYDWQHDQNDYLKLASLDMPPRLAWLCRTIGDDYFTSVVNVNFESTIVVDSDLQCLQGIPDVRWLSLFSTKVSDDGMRHVAALRKLQTLYFFSTAIGDKGLEHIQNSVSLREIQCGDTPVSDDGLQHLRKLTRLEELGLGGTQITDVGLPKLATLQSLKYLDLRRTRVSESGIAKLQQRLPNCRISSDWPAVAKK